MGFLVVQSKLPGRPNLFRAEKNRNTLLPRHKILLYSLQVWLFSLKVLLYNLKVLLYNLKI